MCVAVPPSSGTTKAASGTPTPSTTLPGTTGIDYSQYAGTSPFDLRTRTFAGTGGLPANWSWADWAKASGQPDPTTHDNAGGVITPESAAQWNNVGGHIDPNSGFGPGVGGPVYLAPRNPTTAAPTPFAPVAPVALGTPNPASRPSVIPTQVRDVTPTAQAGTVATPSVAASTTTPTAGAPVSATTPSTSGVSGAFAPSATAYGASQFDAQTPAARVANALTRRFKPDGWFY